MNKEELYLRVIQLDPGMPRFLLQVVKQSFLMNRKCCMEYIVILPSIHVFTEKHKCGKLQ